MRLLTATAALALCVAGAPLAVAQDLRPAPATPQSPTLAAAGPLLTLDMAVTEALAGSPRTAAAAARLDAADGAARQAGALPNPELSVEMENVQGTGPYKGFDSLETTYALSQTIELGGKRDARREAADATRAATRQDLVMARLDLTRDVRLAFAGAVAAQGVRQLAEERARLARETESSTLVRVETGRDAPLQHSRAEIARRQAEIALAQARREEASARQSLAILMGQPALSSGLDEGWFQRLTPPGAVADVPSADANAASTEDTPEVTRRKADLRRSRADLDLERSLAIPDPTVSAGFRRFRDSGDNAFTVGVSVPIPVFNQNRGAIARARAEVMAAEAELAAERLEQERRLTLARGQLAAAFDAASALRDSVVPLAERTFADAGEAYRQGKFSYLDVLDAQGALFDARRDLIDALRGFHVARAELDRLTSITPTGER